MEKQLYRPELFHKSLTSGATEEILLQALRWTLQWLDAPYETLKLFWSSLGCTTLLMAVRFPMQGNVLHWRFSNQILSLAIYHNLRVTISSYFVSLFSVKNFIQKEFSLISVTVCNFSKKADKGFRKQGLFLYFKTTFKRKKSSTADKQFVESMTHFVDISRESPFWRRKYECYSGVHLQN